MCLVSIALGILVCSEESQYQQNLITASVDTRRLKMTVSCRYIAVVKFTSPLSQQDRISVEFLYWCAVIAFQPVIVFKNVSKGDCRQVGFVF